LGWGGGGQADKRRGSGTRRVWCKQGKVKCKYRDKQKKVKQVHQVKLKNEKYRK